MKYNKNADTLLFLSLFTTGQREKKYGIEKKLFVSAGAQKRRKTAGSWSALPQYLLGPKTKFPVKSADKKAKTIPFKVFKVFNDFKNLQQEATKGTPRP